MADWNQIATSIETAGEHVSLAAQSLRATVNDQRDVTREGHQAIKEAASDLRGGLNDIGSGIHAASFQIRDGLATAGSNIREGLEKAATVSSSAKASKDAIDTVAGLFSSVMDRRQTKDKE